MPLNVFLGNLGIQKLEMKSFSNLCGNNIQIFHIVVNIVYFQGIRSYCQLQKDTVLQAEIEFRRQISRQPRTRNGYGAVPLFLNSSSRRSIFI